MTIFLFESYSKWKAAEYWALKLLTHSGFLSEKENSFPDANAILCYRYSVPKILSFDALLRDAQVRDEFFLTTAYPKPQKLFSHDVFLQTKYLIGAAGAL